MMDRELLTLAAAAIGLKITEFAQGGFGDNASVIAATLEGQEAFGWNPLRDDGDALRLAVNLNTVVSVRDQFVHVEWTHAGNPHRVTEACEDHNWNRLTATRRAIVRAAAEIGKQLNSEKD